MTVLEMVNDPQAAAKTARATAVMNKSVENLLRAVDAAFYDTVRALRTQGMIEPATYHTALEILNTATKPYNDAYRA